MSAGTFGRLWIRLTLAGMLLASSLLTVMPAPTYRLWLAEIAITEWGYWLAPVLLLFLPGLWRGSGARRLTAILALVAILLLLRPPLQAWLLGSSLPQLLDDAFGRGEPGFEEEHPAFAPTALLRGEAPPVVAYQTVTYAVRDKDTLQMDVYATEALAPHPAVLIVHGGSWQGGSRTDFAPLSAHLASRGYVVASADYRLAPLARYPAAADDVRAALAHLREHATTLGIDPARLVLLGRSAGGQLALLVGYTEPGVRGVVALYPPTDLEYAYAHPANPAVLDSRGILEDYLGGPPELRASVYREASPIHHVGVGTPPTLLIHGTRDELVFAIHSTRLAERLREAGRPHVHLRLPWATHGCDVHLTGPCGQLTTYAIERFLHAVTGPRP